MKTELPTDLGGYKDLTLTDTLDDRLTIVGTDVLVDGEASDLKAEIDGQTVTLELDRSQLDTLAGKEVTLQITAMIKAGVEIEVIDNQASIQLNDNPAVDSNTVTVTPLEPTEPTEPEPTEPDNNTDSKLPKTGINMSNIHLIGLGLFILGMALSVYRRKSDANR